MKTSIALLLVVTLLLVGGTALAQTGDPAPYTVQSGTAGGGNYQLTSLGWRVSGTVSSGRYSLTPVDRLAGGNQCCCTYLPIILRN